MKVKQTEQDIVVVGQIGKPYGLQGWMRVNSFTEPATNLLDYEAWQIEKHGQWQTLASHEVKMMSNTIMLHIEGCDSPEAARAYTNIKIGVSRDELGELAEDEYYWHDLEGLSVITKKGVTLGTVDYLFKTGANEVLVVKGERERLIPFLNGQVILDVNLAEKIIRVEWDPEF